MRELEMPSTWAGLFPTKNSTTFILHYKDFCFSGTHTIEEDDEVKPVVITITRLYMDDNERNILDIVDPAITYWIEDQLEKAAESF